TSLALKLNSTEACMKKAIMIALVCLTVHTMAASSSASTIFLDTYQTNPFGTPDIGTYQQITGTYAIVDLGGGDKRLRSTATANGFALVAQHTMPPFAPLATVSYDFRIEGNSVLIGANAFGQEAILNPLGDNLDLFWGSDFVLRIF